MRLKRNIKGSAVHASKHIDFQYLIGGMQVERVHKVRKSEHSPSVDSKNDVLYLQACSFGCPAFGDIGNNCSPTSRQAQARRQRRRDVLCAYANRDALHISGFAKIAIVKIDDRRWDGKAQAFAAAAFAKHQSVNT